MMLTEREKEIALQAAHRAAKKYRHKADEPYSFDDGCMIHAFDLFLSRIREEQDGYWAYRVYDPYADSVSYEHAHDKNEAFKADAFAFKIFTTPPATPCDCSELLEALEDIARGPLQETVPFVVYAKNRAMNALANHAKRMKGGAQ